MSKRYRSPNTSGTQRQLTRPGTHKFTMWNGLTYTITVKEPKAVLGAYVWAAVDETGRTIQGAEIFRTPRLAWLDALLLLPYLGER